MTSVQPDTPEPAPRKPLYGPVSAERPESELRGTEAVHGPQNDAQRPHTGGDPDMCPGCRQLPARDVPAILCPGPQETPVTTPADELRIAAERLTHHAGIASPGPWCTTGVGDHGWTVSMPGSGLVVETEDSEQGAVDTDYIALMHPGVGAALATWLESLTGVEISEHAALTEEYQHALAVARAINQQHAA